MDLSRVRRQVAFDRLLCRLFLAPNAPWLLKGGYAMELRFRTARTTRDIDLAMRELPNPPANWDGNVSLVLETLRDAGTFDLKDFFTFIFAAPTADLDAAPYGGARFPVDARLAGRTFANFHLDISTGDVLSEPYEKLSGRDWLEFAGISCMKFVSISPEEQFAEKLHAYTLPRTGRENTRVKDLIDLILLIERTELDAALVSRAIRDTFKRRKTHEIPKTLPLPPTSWLKPFDEMAAECGLDPGIEKQIRTVEKFSGNWRLSVAITQWLQR